MKYTIFLEYNDESESSFDVEIDESPVKANALIMMITRGTLMASIAQKATAYNGDGFDVCSYSK